MGNNFYNSYINNDWVRLSTCCGAEFNINDGRCYCAICNKSEGIEIEGYLKGIDFSSNDYGIGFYSTNNGAA